MGDLRIGQEATVIGTVRRIRTQYTRRRQPIVTVTVFDGTGYLDLSWFNQSWPARRHREGQEVAVSGKVSAFRGRPRVQNPAVEILGGAGADQVHTGRIVPVHPAGEGVSTGVIRRLVHEALRRVPLLADPIPEDVRHRRDLPPLHQAVRDIHFPETDEDRARALERLKFDELFFLELGVAFRKHRVEAETDGVAHVPATDLVPRFIDALPFEPTRAQRRAMDEGAAIMAPTEVLAGQHFRTVESLLGPIGGRRLRPTNDGPQASLLEGDGPHYALLTSAVTGKERERVLEGAASGGLDLLVGTHALVQEAVEFADLSLVVVDEQHRFGLHQRIALKEKGASPDVLIMTATPIPRTLALTYYGDLDVSVLDEPPAGRRPVRTRVVRTAADRRKAYDLVREQVRQGRQAFVVCAAIDEENRLEVRAAEKEAERLRTEVFPDLRIALLHGRMRPKEKEARMEAVRAGQADVLISTTVIEVGVDVPNATVMLVENAERFGLAQLHQLRGRIGRGEHKSYCILLTSAQAKEASAKLAVLERTRDGFEVAEADWKLRGPGDLLGTAQSGLPALKIGNLRTDAHLMRRARAAAVSIL